LYSINNFADLIKNEMKNKRRMNLKSSQIVASGEAISILAIPISWLPILKPIIKRIMINKEPAKVINKLGTESFSTKALARFGRKIIIVTKNNEESNGRGTLRNLVKIKSIAEGIITTNNKV